MQPGPIGGLLQGRGGGLIDKSTRTDSNRQGMNAVPRWSPLLAWTGCRERTGKEPTLGSPSGCRTG